jgi:symplekin
LLALKFVQAVILLYTPDPNGSSEPPPHDGNKILLCISSSAGLKDKDMQFRYVNNTTQTNCICLYSMLTYFVGKFVEFNISWLRGGHPKLNVGDLSIEASHRLGLLLDQLRFPTVKSLSNSVIVVLINRYFGYSWS